MLLVGSLIWFGWNICPCSFDFLFLADQFKCLVDKRSLASNCQSEKAKNVGLEGQLYDMEVDLKNSDIYCLVFGKEHEAQRYYFSLLERKSK